MFKRFFEELGILILINGLVFIIYATAFGSDFHATVPGDQAFEDFNAKAIGSFLFFYPTLINVSFLVYFIRAKLVKYSNSMVNNYLFALNALAIGFPIIGWMYSQGFDALIEKKAPHYDSFALPIAFVQYSLFPIIFLLYYNAHYIPLGKKYDSEFEYEEFDEETGESLHYVHEEDSKSE